MIELTHGADGKLYLFKDGKVIDKARWSPKVGDDYEFELNYNLESKDVKLYIDGERIYTGWQRWRNWVRKIKYAIFGKPRRKYS